MSPRRTEHLIRPRDLKWLLVLGAAVVAALMSLAIVLSGPLDLATRLFINNIGLVLAGLAVIVLAAVAARRGPHRQQRAWQLLSVSAMFLVLGIEWYVLCGAMRWTRISIVGDVGFLASSLLAIWGMTSFPTTPRRGRELLRMVLDGVVVGGSVLLTTTVFALAPVLSEGQNPVFRADTIALMIIDVIVATVAGLLLIRGDRADRPVQLLLALGFSIWAVTDLVRWVVTVRGQIFYQSAGPVGWMLAYSLIAFAALLPGRIRTVESPARSNEAPPLGDTVMTFGLLLVAAVANALIKTPADLNPWVGAIWLLLVAAVVARQLLLITDNELLRRALERRVHSRTRELASMTRQSELLLNSVGDGIYGVDSRGVITFVNPSGARTLGYSAEELIGQHAHDRFHAPQPDGTPYDYNGCYIKEAIETGLTTSGEEDLYLGVNGREIPVEVTSSPLHSDTSTGAVIVFRDITSRREVDRMKQEFVSVVSHELRTPLTAIRGSLGLLSGDRLGELSPQARRMIGIALDSTERLGRLVNDILDIERMESGSMPMDFRDHDVSEFVQTAAAQLRPIAAESGVRIDTGPAVGLVNADGDRIVQTLVNLIGNAIKFSPSGGVVTVGAEPGPGAGSDPDGEPQVVVFTVRDQGRGIPVDKLEQIFERFEQVDSSDGREMGGSGLGLSISRSIVERHDGRIWAESPPGGGAVFRFTLPRVFPTPEESEPSEPAADELADTPPAASRPETGSEQPIGR